MISTKGMRRITVGGHRYLWRFRQDEDYCRHGSVTVVREDLNVLGNAPRLWFTVRHAHQLVTPKVVRRAIEYAVTVPVNAVNEINLDADQSARLFE